jgi:hypothetical protein
MQGRSINKKNTADITKIKINVKIAKIKILLEYPLEKGYLPNIKIMDRCSK